jgi:YidC/Oxa1 family membrane protein insertase
MDKRTIQGYVLIFLIFIGFTWFQKDTFDEADKIDEQEQEEVQEESVANNAKEDSSTIIRIAEDTGSTKPAVITTLAEEDTGALIQEVASPAIISTIENEELRIDLSSKGGKIVKVSLKNYKRFDSTALDILDSGAFDFNYTFNTNSGIVSTTELDFQSADVTDTSIVFTHTFAEGGTFVQNYALNKDFLIDYTVSLNGMDKVIPVRNREYMLDFGAKMRQQEKGLKEERNETTIFYRYANESDVDRLSKTSNDDEEMHPNLHWISFKQKFFNSTFFFSSFNQETGNKLIIDVPEEDDSYLKTLGAEFNMAYNGTDRDGFKMQMFFGPNHYQTLARLDKHLDKQENARLEKIIPLGWGIIGWINQLVIIPVFNWLNSFISNYGLIILILTLMIKIVLIFPMYKIYISSAKMKLLKPELDELKKKTGGDMKKMQQEQMKLYKKAGVNPFGGCLPQLVQFPILIAMFRFFPASIELRQQKFLWATDLSTYDSIYNFGQSLWIYGDHISLFTLMMAASTFLYTLSNSNMNAGMNQQMKFIMYLMPLMLLFWFNNYAAGLSYYYFLANMITFGQNFIFRKFVVDEDKLHRKMQANKKKKGSGKKTRFQKKLEDMAKKQGLDPGTMKPRK